MGEFVKRMTKEQDRQLALGRNGNIPYYVIYEMLEEAKKEFQYMVEIYRKMNYSVEGMKVLIEKWFGE